MKRIGVNCIILLVIITFISSCAFEPDLKKTQAADEGQVFLYISCPEKPTFDITFSIAGISFLRQSEEWIDLAMEKLVHSADLLDRQIKLFEFYLPAGKYKQIKITISEAKLRKNGKTFSLAVPQPEGEYFIDIKTSLERGESSALFIDWNPQQSVYDKYLFQPEMTIRKQGIEIKNVLAYVTNTDSNCVAVIDRHADKVVAMIAVGQSPMGISASADGSRIYVANSGSNNISVIDTYTRGLINTISNFNYSPAELALSKDGQTLYATNPDSDNISVIDTVSNMPTAFIPVGRRPLGIEVDQDRREIYVANSKSNSISIIDMADNRVKDTATVGFNPIDVAVQDDMLYVTNAGSNNISVMDLSSHSIVKTMRLFGSPTCLVPGLSGRIYVSNANNEISIIYASMSMITKNISVGKNPAKMAVDSFRKKLYVVNSLSEDVSVIDLTKKKLETIIQVGRKPHGIALIEE